MALAAVIEERKIPGDDSEDESECVDVTSHAMDVDTAEFSHQSIAPLLIGSLPQMRHVTQWAVTTRSRTLRTMTRPQHDDVLL